uniref:Uncharacterized protein n=1 Tax=Hucho hucho TaxID=62062 RepID=A0A4W5PV75_9TELE
MWRASICLRRLGRLPLCPSPMSSGTTPQRPCPTYLKPQPPSMASLGTVPTANVTAHTRTVARATTCQRVGVKSTVLLCVKCLIQVSLEKGLLIPMVLPGEISWEKHLPLCLYHRSAGNTNFHNSFPCQPESQTVAYSHRPSWSEECSQEAPSTWDTAGCVGSKPYFPATRSLSPMSSLFGSIWTPQSEPYQSHFQPERSVPMSPVSPVCPITPPHAPFNREPGGMCRLKQYSSFNPFGPHMNLDIWNSSSNRSSNSQLSSDSGYCGDV